MADFDLPARYIALGGILTALDYPTPTWTTALDGVAADAPLTTLDDVARVTEHLKALHDEIVGAYIAEQDGAEEIGLAALADEAALLNPSTEQVKKTTRMAANNDS